MLIALVALGVAGAIYQSIAAMFDRQAYPAPGQLVDVGGYQLHIRCIGTGSPTVILESGLASPSSVWGWVQPEVGATTRACVYDRAGVGWSEPGPTPREGRQIARELHTLLQNAGVAGPYVLVGHSFGGLYARAFAEDYADEVAGMVLVDSSHPEQWSRLPGGQEQYQGIRRLSALAPILARLGLLRLADATPLNHDLPPRQAAEYKTFADTAAYADINRDEFAGALATSAALRDASGLGERPLFVLTATDHGDPAGESAWQALQRELAALSTNRIHRVVAGSSHASLLLDRDDAQNTASAIRQVVEAVRAHRSLAR
jgi:pimeloyl-ACP methyl ester carboxylesterase